MQSLECPQGIFQLHRFPLRKNEPLRAWDAADEYLLQHVDEQGWSTQGWAILNDGFGALSIALAHLKPVTIGDSEMGRLALQYNAEQNPSIQGDGTFLSCLENWPAHLKVVLIKVPKTLSLLQYQLCRLRAVIDADTVVVGAGMTRDVHTSTIKAFESMIGPTTTSLARKKARLIFSQVDQNTEQNQPAELEIFRTPELEFELHEYPGIFSRGKLDNGTRLLLENLPEVEPGSRVVDLGCGSGVLGLTIVRRQATAKVEFIDESYLAVASARESWSQMKGPYAQASFTVAHGLSTAEHKTIDLVLCNPPFHQGRVMGDHLAWAMFTQAHRALKPGGELRIVGNRHLGYHTSLKRIFGHCTTIASNRKFVVLSARRRNEGGPS